MLSLIPEGVPMTRILGVILVVAVIVAADYAAAQSNYPEKPIRIVVGFSAGSTVDVAARILGQKLGERVGKPVVIDNMTGVAGNIAAERVAKATPDGYTLALAGNGQLVINPSLYRLTYDTVKDFAPVSQVYVSSNMLVVHNSVPARNVRELIALAKAHPGELTYASGGSGSAPHIAGELLKSMTGVDIRHIPYKGVVTAIPDLITGRVMMTIGPTSQVMAVVREGKLRALAVTSLTRSAAFPDVPTIDESGVPGYEASLWAGLLAPSGTPVAIVRKLHAEIVKVLALRDVHARFADLGMDVIGNSPEEFATVIKNEIPKWAKLVRESGIKAD